MNQTRIDQSGHHNLSASKLLRRVMVLLVIGIISVSCTIKVPVHPEVENIDIAEKLPVEVGLLITEKTRSYVFRGYPESFTGGGRPHEFFGSPGTAVMGYRYNRVG